MGDGFIIPSAAAAGVLDRVDSFHIIVFMVPLLRPGAEEKDGNAYWPHLSLIEFI